MMFRLTTLVVAFGLAGPAAAAPAAKRFQPGSLRGLVRISLPDAFPEGKCSICPDGYCSWFKVTGRAKSTVSRLQRPLRAGRYGLVLQRRLSGMRILVAGSTGPVRCHITRIGKQTVLYVGTPSRKQLLRKLRRFILEKPPLLSPGLAKRLAPVERLVHRAAKKGDRRPALRALAKLERDVLLADYAKVRKADVAMLSGMIPTAYTRYRLLARNSSAWGGVGLVASLCANALAYVVDGVPTSRPLYRAIAKLDTPYGRRAQPLLISLLAHQGKLQAAFMLARQSKAPEVRGKALHLAEAVLRRCELAGTPRCGALTIYRAEAMLPKAKRGGEILLSGVRSFLALGLPKEAARLAQEMLQRKPRRPLQERAMALLVRAYAEGSQRYRALRAAAYYLSLYGKRAPGYTDVQSIRAELLLGAGRVQRLRLVRGLPPTLALQVQRALAIARGAVDKVDGPLFARLAALRKAQARLTRLLAAIQQGGQAASGRPR